MFEVKDLIGRYHRGGFVSYADACQHATDKMNEEGRAYTVSEVVLRCIIRPSKEPRK